jgi:hypothetical protein
LKVAGSSLAGVQPWPLTLVVSRDSTGWRGFASTARPPEFATAAGPLISPVFVQSQQITSIESYPIGIHNQLIADIMGVIHT